MYFKIDPRLTHVWVAGSLSGEHPVELFDEEKIPSCSVHSETSLTCLSLTVWINLVRGSKDFGVN